MRESLPAGSVYGSAINYKLGQLRSYRVDYSDQEFADEMHRVFMETAVEREWTKDLEPYATDEAILMAAQNGELVSVTQQRGLIPIRRLLDYSLARANPSHVLYYSPPYLRPQAATVANYIAQSWADLQADDQSTSLALTSAVRSANYQANLSQRDERKVAIDVSSGAQSSHAYGLAFDIDGCGIYKATSNDGKMVAFNPRVNGYESVRIEVDKARQDLKNILFCLKEQDIINYVEEVPGTQEWCFHICTNPSIF